MADSDIHGDHEEPTNARHHAGRDNVLQPSKSGSDDASSPEAWPLESLAGIKAHADQFVQEYIRLCKLRPKTRSDSLLSSYGDIIVAVERYVERVMIMEATMSTDAEETGQEEKTSQPPDLPADSEVPLRDDDYLPPHDRDGAQDTTAIPEDVSAITDVPVLKDKIGQAQSGIVGAGQMKK